MLVLYSRCSISSLLRQTNKGLLKKQKGKVKTGVDIVATYSTKGILLAISLPCIRMDCSAVHTHAHHWCVQNNFLPDATNIEVMPSEDQHLQ